MICVVIGHQQGFAENGLAVAPWDSGQQVGLGIFYQILHRLEVLPEFFHTCIPNGGGRRSFCLRPIPFGPFRRDVFRVAAEFQNVPLRDAQVFQQHPERVGQAGRLLSKQFVRNVGDYFFELGVGATSIEQVNHMLAQHLVFILIFAVFFHGSRLLSIVASEPADRLMTLSASCSDFSPRYTRAMPRTMRRIGSEPFSSRKKTSPAWLLRQYQRFNNTRCSMVSSAVPVVAAGNQARASCTRDSIDCDLACSTD